MVWNENLNVFSGVGGDTITHMCVCVCETERERHRERDTERETEKRRSHSLAAAPSCIWKPSLCYHGDTRVGKHCGYSRPSPLGGFLTALGKNKNDLRAFACVCGGICVSMETQREGTLQTWCVCVCACVQACVCPCMHVYWCLCVCTVVKQSSGPLLHRRA